MRVLGPWAFRWGSWWPVVAWFLLLVGLGLLVLLLRLVVCCVAQSWAVCLIGLVLLDKWWLPGSSNANVLSTMFLEVSPDGGVPVVELVDDLSFSLSS